MSLWLNECDDCVTLQDPELNNTVQERRVCSALAVALRLSCTSPSIWHQICCTIYVRKRYLHVFNSLRQSDVFVGNLTTIGSDNGLSHGRRQAIFWTSAGILSIWALGSKLQWLFIRNSNIFMQENAFENVSEMAAILSRPQCVNVVVIVLCSCIVYECRCVYMWTYVWQSA